MKVAILGATGHTGQQLVAQALAAGHQVVAIVRDASKLTISHEELSIVVGDIFSEEDLKKHLQGVDAVMSTLGFQPTKGLTSYSTMTKCLVNVLREVSCTRAVFLHSWYTRPEARKKGSFFLRWVLFPIIGSVLDDMRTSEEYLLSHCSDINYTVVRPPSLNDGPLTDMGYDVLDDGDVIVGGTSKISYADVARYMLGLLDDESSYSKFHAIAIKSS